MPNNGVSFLEKAEHRGKIHQPVEKTSNYFPCVWIWLNLFSVPLAITMSEGIQCSRVIQKTAESPEQPLMESSCFRLLGKWLLGESQVARNGFCYVFPLFLIKTLLYLNSSSKHDCDVDLAFYSNHFCNNHFHNECKISLLVDTTHRLGKDDPHLIVYCLHFKHLLLTLYSYGTWKDCERHTT